MKYEDMTVEELKARCRERGISGYSGLKKAQIIKLLRGGKGSKKASKKASKKGSRKAKKSKGSKKASKGSKGRSKKSVAGGACVTSKNCRKGYTCDREQLVCREYLPRGRLAGVYGPKLPKGWRPQFGPHVPEGFEEARVLREELQKREKELAKGGKIPCELYDGPLMCKLEGCSWEQPGGPCREK